MSSDPDTRCSDWRAMATQMQDKLREVEFVYDAYFNANMCPDCEGVKPDHSDDCELAALLSMRLNEVESMRVCSFDAVKHVALVDKTRRAREMVGKENDENDARPRAGR